MEELVIRARLETAGITKGVQNAIREAQRLQQQVQRTVGNAATVSPEAVRSVERLAAATTQASDQARLGAANFLDWSRVVRAADTTAKQAVTSEQQLATAVVQTGQAAKIGAANWLDWTVAARATDAAAKQAVTTQQQLAAATTQTAQANAASGRSLLTVAQQHAAQDQAMRRSIGVTDQMIARQRTLGTVQATTARQGQAAATQLAGSMTVLNSASRGAGVSINSLRSPLTTLLIGATGATPAVAQLSSMIGSMALGTGLTLGILAGLAAIAAGFKLLTADAREAAKEVKDARDRLTELADQQELAEIGGQVVLDVEQAEKDISNFTAALVLARQERERLRGVPGGEDVAIQNIEELEDKKSAAIRRRLAGLRQISEAEAQAAEDAANAARTAEEALDRAAAVARDKLAAGLREAAAAAEVLRKAMADIDTRMAAMTLPASLTNGMVITVDAIDRLIVKMRDLEARQKAFTGQGGTLSPLSARGVRPPADTGAAIDSSFLSSVRGAFDDLGAAIEAKLTPAALAAAGAFAVFAPIVKGAGEVLRPAIDALIEPLVQLGRELGNVLRPVLQALAPVVAALTQIWKGLSLLNPVVQQFMIALKILEPILRGVTVVLSYFQQGLGEIIKFIGRALNILPGSPGDSFVKAGQEMIDAARAARGPIEEAAGEVAEVLRAFGATLDDARRERELGNKLRGIELDPMQEVAGVLNDLKNTFPVLFEKIFAGIDLSNMAGVREAAVRFFDSIKGLSGVDLTAALAGAPIDEVLSWLGLFGDSLNAVTKAAQDTATSLRGVPEVFNFTLASIRAAGTREFLPQAGGPSRFGPDRDPRTSQDNRTTVAAGAVVVNVAQDGDDLLEKIATVVATGLERAAALGGKTLTASEIRRMLKPELVSAAESKGSDARAFARAFPG